MGDSKIEWTEKTWNPVTGCIKVSTGCKHCYAERLFPRVYGKDMVAHPTRPRAERPRKFTDVKLHPERLEQPLHWKKPRMIFVNSMSDLFHEDVPFGFIESIFRVMFLAKQHIFQILTKRPHRALEYIKMFGKTKLIWPLPNVWLGISCENQVTADERIPILLQVPAAVRFLSCEPLLANLNLDGRAFWINCCGCTEPENDIATKDCLECGGTACVPGIDWVIVGGESGPKHRPMELNWARSIQAECKEAGVPFFFKQTGGKKAIPDDLQTREFPKWQKA